MAMLPILPQLISQDMNGEQISYLDDETGELHLAFYAIDTTDPMNQFATHVIKMVVTPTEVIPLT
jgi:hypothetical protein